MRGTVALLVGIVVFAACVPAPASAATSSTYVAGTQIEPDDVLLEVSVQSDGSAMWTVEYRVRLDDENATAAFDSVQEDVEQNSTAFASPFADRMRATASAASNATDREMSVRNVSVTATRRQLPQEYGVITYRFEWTGFAAVDGETLRVGDALAGFFLDGETTLLVSWPDDYAATNVVPAPDERRTNAVVWIGPTDFTAGEPRIDLQRSETGGGDPGGTDAPGGNGTPTPSGGGGPGLGSLLVAGLLGALLAAGGVWYYWRSREPTAAAEAGDSETTAEETAPTPDPSTETDANATTDPEPNPEEPEPDPEPEAEPDPEPPEALLSNEERVRRLLKQHGGRMKQQEVADALDWSAAKTSQVVTKMRDEDELDSFRLGRENVLSLPEESMDEFE